MNWIGIAKQTACLVAGSAVSTVVQNLIRSTTPAITSQYNKVLTVIGGVIISGMVSKAAYNYVEKEIDNSLKRAVSVVEKDAIATVSDQELIEKLADDEVVTEVVEEMAGEAPAERGFGDRFPNLTKDEIRQELGLSALPKNEIIDMENLSIADGLIIKAVNEEFEKAYSTTDLQLPKRVRKKK